MPTEQNPLSPLDQEVLRTLATANTQYDRYLELTRLAALPSATIKAQPTTQSWGHPLTIVVCDEPRNAVME